MRVPRLIQDFFDWRWAPCVALTLGALSFVALSLLLIPTRIAGTLHESELSSRDDRLTAPPQRALFGASLARDIGQSEPLPVEPAATAPLRIATPTSVSDDPRATQRRGFSPVRDRPEPPLTALPPEPVPPIMPVMPAQAAEPAPAGREIVVQ